jgi:hypothetical protein
MGEPTAGPGSGRGRQINRREFLQRSGAAAAFLAAPAIVRRAAAQPAAAQAPLTRAALRTLASRLLGEALLPGDPGYDDMCQDWAGQLRLRPGVAVRCMSTSDVAAAVVFAREHDLPLAVRSGGHAFRSTDGGVLVNLTGLRQVNVDPRARIARADAGLLLGDLDRASGPSGLAAVLGECPSVGLAGYTLGGGLGRLMGRHGSASDNLVSAEVVTADGRVLHASAGENPDLFWAIRGGGGNFGVVTSFEHRLHPVGQVLAGTIEYPLASARSTIGFFRDFMSEAPDDLDALIEMGTILQYAPDSREPRIVVNVCCAGERAAAERTLRPLRAFGAPARDTIRSMPYFEAQTLGANLARLRTYLGPGYARAARNGFVARLTDAALDVLVEHLEEPPSAAWGVAFDHYLHGEVCRVPAAASAFALRQRGFSFRLVAFEQGRGPAERSAAWVRTLHAGLDRFSDGLMYLNYVTDQGEAGVRASMKGNYDRLVAVKRRYDPTNFFHLNPNIAPDASTG